MPSTTFPLAIDETSPFGLYNLPFGIFSTSHGVGLGTRPRAGVAIGQHVLELHLLASHGLFDAVSPRSQELKDVFLQAELNSYASLPPVERTKLRSCLIENLSNAQSPLFTDPKLNEHAFDSLDDVQMHLPMKMTDYTDSFSSLVHAQNCLEPLGLALPKAFVEFPQTYNGRLSSIRVSGTDVVRPSGWYPKGEEGDEKPTFQPTAQLDFEIEVGTFISKPIPYGTRVTAKEAAEHIFGFVLLNDWSARDIQKYEMPPLGPFHSKGFITTISPWIVTLDALRSCTGGPPASNSTDIHPWLVADKDNHGVYDIEFKASVSRGGHPDVEIVRTNFTDSYWSLPQQIAYQSSSGLGINTGDLIASGTISSPAPKTEDRASGVATRGTYGCLLEAFAQNHVLPKPGGKAMSYLEDGDVFTIEGCFTTEDGRRCGFGGVSSLVLPAKAS